MNQTQFRTQLYLDSARHKWLKQRAAKENKSVARVVREALDKARKVQEKTEAERKRKAYKNLLKLVGSIKTGPADVSRNHDKYLGEALYKEMVDHRKTTKNK